MTSVHKVAHIISGIPPSYMPIEDVNFYVNRQLKLIQADVVFFQTWHGYKNRLNGFEYEDNLTCINEPRVDYEPYSLIEGFQKLPWLRFHYQNNRVLQILGFAMMIEKMKGLGYTHYIRTRYDTWVSRRFNKNDQQYFHKRAGVIGFESQASSYHKHLSKDASLVAERKQYLQDLKMGKSIYNHRWSTVPDVLGDFMIFMEANRFDSSKIIKMFRQKELKPAEWGWYQSVGGQGDTNTVTIPSFVALYRHVHKYEKPMDDTDT
jgi:hypothetical protein